jgi:hypothetical protein
LVGGGKAALACKSVTEVVAKLGKQKALFDAVRWHGKDAPSSLWMLIKLGNVE